MIRAKTIHVFDDQNQFRHMFEFTNGLIVQIEECVGLVFFSNRNSLLAKPDVIDIKQSDEEATFTAETLEDSLSEDEDSTVINLVQELCDRPHNIKKLREQLIEANTAIYHTECRQKELTKQAKVISNLVNQHFENNQVVKGDLISEKILTLNKDYEQDAKAKQKIEIRAEQTKKALKNAYKVAFEEDNIYVDYLFYIDTNDKPSFVCISTTITQTEQSILAQLFYGYGYRLVFNGNKLKMQAKIEDNDTKTWVYETITKMEVLQLLKPLMNPRNLDLLNKYQLPIFSSQL